MKPLRLACLSLLCAALPLCALAAVPALRSYDRQQGYQYVTYGAYPQGAAGEALPILWRVLSVEDGAAYLLSEYVLEPGQMHHAWEAYGAWPETDLYAHLNGAFLRSAFTPAQQAALAQRPAPGTVFLPSEADITNPAYGFAGNADRQAPFTPYAQAQGLFVYRGGRFSPYWTRDRDTKHQDGSPRRVLEGGKMGFIRAIVENLGPRPGVLLHVGAAQALGGAGTRDNPLVLDALP
ncbi:MAG: hypothetical protein LBU67_08560 [Oscillospiraceae bacterium]|jgi:hypothetical protein|nr:hypothetical protein [Oscillospiraceae bacterium]